MLPLTPRSFKKTELFCLFVHCMFSALRTKLFQFQPIRRCRLILGFRIIPIFALRAFHLYNDSCHKLFYYLRYNSRANRTAPFSDGEPKFLFHRDRRD